MSVSPISIWNVAWLIASRRSQFVTRVRREIRQPGCPPGIIEVAGQRRAGRAHRPDVQIVRTRQRREAPQEIRVPPADRMPDGTAPSESRKDSRNRLHELHNRGRTTGSVGSTASSREQDHDAGDVDNGGRQAAPPARCRNAPRMFRSLFVPGHQQPRRIPFSAMPAAATMVTVPPATSPGLSSLRIACQAMAPVATSNVTALIARKEWRRSHSHHVKRAVGWRRPST